MSRRRGDPLWDLDGPEYVNDEPREDSMRTISLYGEHDEKDDPALVERKIKDAFIQLNETGYRDLAKALHYEIGVALELDEYLKGRKSSYRAKLDGDWDRFLAEIHACQSRDDLRRWQIENISRLSMVPRGWIEPLHDEFYRRMIEIEENE